MKQSAGILLYRPQAISWELFLVHPGGPFWKNKDLGAWSIPKGELGDNENALDAAIREFQEETGFTCSGKFLPLTPRKQGSSKMVHAWALEKDINAALLQCNLFSMEWPPKSGQFKEFPEIDKGAWFTPDMAKEKIIPGQVGFIDELLQLLSN